MFPLPPAQLDGCRVLLIQISESDPQLAYFSSGTAHWTGSELRVQAASGEVVARGSEDALRGFDPAVLPRLMLPEALAHLSELRDGVDACVAFISRDEARGALCLHRPFFGLASGPDGEAFLMQVDPDILDDAGSEDEPGDEHEWGDDEFDIDVRAT